MTLLEPKILLSGTTGYVGGRLLKSLEQKNIPLRCLLRRPEVLQGQVSKTTELARGDVFDLPSLISAMQGIKTAYYLIHSLTSKGVFDEEEKKAAENFAEAARLCGVEKIIYLGGLGSKEDELSDHLKSRQKVGSLLRHSGAVVIEFRASVIIGSGSISFEIVRALVEKLPVMITPRWVRTKTQPIAIEDVIAYLEFALEKDFSKSEIFEIGGKDVLPYQDLMLEYAKQRGLRRHFIAVPFLSPHLSSLWLSLVTPAYQRVGRRLVEGLKNPTFVQNTKALDTFPIKAMGVSEAIHRALKNEDKEFIQTHWSDAFSSGKIAKENTPALFGTRLSDARQIQLPLTAAQAFAPIQRIGGLNGWYYADLLWNLRGLLDLFIGGVGMRRGRRDPVDLNIGDAIDFWRVEAFEPSQRLLLRAEMKVPGRAWLEFEVEQNQQGSILHQTAIFDPLGIAGRLYWYALLPFHWLIFERMLRRIAKKALHPG